MRHPFDLIIVDYLQLVQVTDRLARENRTREMSDILENIKQLALEIPYAIIGVFQLSRETKRRSDK